MSFSHMLSSFPIFPIITSWTQIAFTFLGVIGTILLGVYLSLWPYREYTLPFRNLDGEWPNAHPRLIAIQAQRGVTCSSDSFRP